MRVDKESGYGVDFSYKKAASILDNDRFVSYVARRSWIVLSQHESGVKLLFKNGRRAYEEKNESDLFFRYPLRVVKTGSPWENTEEAKLTDEDKSAKDWCVVVLEKSGGTPCEWVGPGVPGVPGTIPVSFGEFADVMGLGVGGGYARKLPHPTPYGKAGAKGARGGPGGGVNEGHMIIVPKATSNRLYCLTLIKPKDCGLFFGYGKAIKILNEEPYSYVSKWEWFVSEPLGQSPVKWAKVLFRNNDGGFRVWDLVIDSGTIYKVDASDSNDCDWCQVMVKVMVPF